MKSKDKFFNDQKDIIQSKVFEHFFLPIVKSSLLIETFSKYVKVSFLLLTKPTLSKQILLQYLYLNISIRSFEEENYYI